MAFKSSICYDSFTNWDEKIKGGDTLTKEDMKQISDLMDEKFVAFETRIFPADFIIRITQVQAYRRPQHGSRI